MGRSRARFLAISGASITGRPCAVARDIRKTCIDIDVFHLAEHGISRQQPDDLLTKAHVQKRAELRQRLGLAFRAQEVAAALGRGS